MLVELSIKNYIIIEHEIINFTTGLNVITGETGAGKSLIIDAINVISGGKLSKEDIRQGANKVIIEALFSIDKYIDIRLKLDEYGIEYEEDNTILISREVNTTGKSICRINGQIVTLSMLKAIMIGILDIVGQNEHQQLLNSSRHIDFVDQVGGNKISKICSDIKILTESIKDIEKKLKNICGEIGEREKRLDLLSFQMNEITNAKLKLNEDVELKNRRMILTNAEKIYKNISYVYQKLYNANQNYSSVIDTIYECTSCLSEVSSIDNEIDIYKNVLENILYQFEDLKNGIRQYKDNIEFNDNEIDEIEERLDLITRLKRKYGSSIEEIINYKNSVLEQYDELVNSEKLSIQLNNEIENLKAMYFDKANQLSKIRKQMAEKLEKLVEKELQDLNMQGAKFSIYINTEQAIINPKGLDKVEFLISPNPGEVAKPLNKIASGGEMSRVMLALKNALAELQQMPCVVFDEVDAGIGGVTATMVGQKIKHISKNSQTICITHLPQIACYSDNHIYIDKTVVDDKTYTKLKSLDDEQRIYELARMLGGNTYTKTSLIHAKELITNCKQLP